VTKAAESGSLEVGQQPAELHVYRKSADRKTMIAIRLLFSLFCGCFVIVNSQSTVDETSSQCLWNNDEYVLHTVERTCRPTQQLLRVNQQLLHRHEQLLNQVSAELTCIKGQQSCPTDEKQQFVSALTGDYVCIALIYATRIMSGGRCRPCNTGGAGPVDNPSTLIYCVSRLQKLYPNSSTNF